MVKVVYLISDIDKAVAFEWIVEYINNDKIELSFILVNGGTSYLFKYLQRQNIPVYLITCPGKKYIPAAIFKCYRILKRINPEAVHCHLFFANIIGLTSAKILGIEKRIYTRHHSDYHHIYFPNAVKWDKYCNALATQIVSISDNVSNILINNENVPPGKIVKIWHGFDLKKFSSPDQQKVNALRHQYNAEQKHPVVGVISRAIRLKGIQYIIPAYSRLLEDFPNALLLLFNAEGDFENEVDGLLAELPNESYKKIVFENDITNLYHVFDLFIHVPISPSVEAFGQTYIEALASGVPLIATKSGIANEILVDRENSIVVDYQNSDEIYQAIQLLLSNPDLCYRMTKNGKIIIAEKFRLVSMIQKLENLYLQ